MSMVSLQVQLLYYSADHKLHDGGAADEAEASSSEDDHVQFVQVQEKAWFFLATCDGETLGIWRCWKRISCYLMVILSCSPDFLHNSSGQVILLNQVLEQEKTIIKWYIRASTENH